MSVRKLMPYLVRAASTAAGAGILHHEIWQVESAEPLLVFVGLWLAGAPIADLFDKLRRLAQLTPETPSGDGEPPPPSQDRRTADP